MTKVWIRKDIKGRHICKVVKVMIKTVEFYVSLFPSSSSFFENILKDGKENKYL